jgi:transposase
MSDEFLPGMALAGSPQAGHAVDQAAGGGSFRLRRPDRLQVALEPCCLDEALGQDHPARLVWGLVERLDLSVFMEAVAAREGVPGRDATDPALLVGLWLYATIDNVGSARRLARLCGEHDAYRWLCGRVSVNHHMLSDFRVGHGAALDGLLTQLIAALRAQGVIDGERISQDSLRVRAAAGRSSYRRRATLEKLRDQAKEDVRRLKEQVQDPDDPTTDKRKQAARERAARERQERAEEALRLLPELEEVKTHHTGKPSKGREARVSTTDPEARRMKRGDGSIGPAYNLQFAVDARSRVVVGVSVHTGGDDQSQSTPMRERVEARTNTAVKEHLYDGGYVDKEEIQKAADAGVKVYAPLPKGKDGEPCTHARKDTAGVAAWRTRMMTEEAKEVYKLRASTSETVNADVSMNRTLGRLNVRGPGKVLCVALWATLAHHVVHRGPELLAALAA